MGSAAKDDICLCISEGYSTSLGLIGLAGLAQLAGTLAVVGAGGLLIEDIAKGQESDNPFVRMLAGSGAAHPPDPDDEQGSKSSKATVTSRIRGDTLLEKAAQQVGKNPRQQKDVDSIVAKFQSGISNPGIGSKSLPNTDVYYLRTRSGARVFFRNNDQGFEIVGKANKSNEDSVIARLTQIYGR